MQQRSYIFWLRSHLHILLAYIICLFLQRRFFKEQFIQSDLKLKRNQNVYCFSWAFFKYFLNTATSPIAQPYPSSLLTKATEYIFPSLASIFVPLEQQQGGKKLSECRSRGFLQIFNPSQETWCGGNKYSDSRIWRCCSSPVQREVSVNRLMHKSCVRSFL